MYNTNFIVKYNDIKEELIHKLKNKTDQEYIDIPDPEYEYSSQDILDICHKLYMDELSSVFYAENIIDDKIDQGIQYVLEKMLDNSDFKNIIDKMKELINFSTITDEHKSNLNENGDLMVLLILFSKPIFYVTHKCICQQFNTGSIDSQLIEELNQYIITVLQN
jgi:hypothetical protein